MHDVNDNLDALLRRAIELHRAGRREEAQVLYRQVLQQDPRHAGALYMLALLAWEAGQLEQAEGLVREVLAIEPGRVRAHNLRGIVLRHLGRAVEAEAACRQALALDGAFAEAYVSLGGALYVQGKLPEALAAFEKAMALDPGMPESYMNVGVMLYEQGRVEEAIGAFERALALAPNLAAVYNNLATALKDVGRQEEAIAACRRALALAPKLAAAYDNLLFTLQYHPGYDARAMAREYAVWNRQVAVALRGQAQGHGNDRDPERRLRIGYVSPDFRWHAVGWTMLPLFRQHDKRAVEVFAYAQVARPDEMTRQFRGYADYWREVGGVPDERVAALIREDGIDILVDLALHSAGNRLLVLARKPAPVQVTFAGYPGTTGLETMDYRLTDPYLDPVGMDESVYSEKTVRLPHTWWCYEAMAGSPGVGRLPCGEAGVVTFGCLNNFCKVNEGVLRLWGQVLRKVAGSRVLLLAPEGSARAWVLRVLAQEGIGGERVRFTAKLPREQYLALYQQMDIALDTVPYNGHTTSLDALWMGVPVVTLVGQTVVGRAGWSQLMNVGLRELAAHTAEEFVEMAVGLAGDKVRLAELRGSLRQKLQGSPIMDQVGFARDIEAAYRMMWRAWCAGPVT
jgi:protein O-GlcNAc transferase